ncbi:M14 family metallopeptidase [Luteimonas sp. XNQY3]|nr:M14 family metallopeptidase [Luteimonas sp. XNQY3]MCD9007914.1 M14 family metallopeptidase [Luteimonas sp. XNQY3]
MPSPRLPLALALLLSALPAAAADDPRITIAERSGFVETGRYDEVIALCETFARLHPDAVRCIRFGTSPEGRPMQALIASRSGALDPEAAHAAGVPVVLVQGGIHAGEIDGKDAGFLALRELLDGSAAPGALDDAVLVFVPVFSVDGHERFGAWNRPNQRGPREMGWRTTAQNLNLNRDYAKADAPEMQAMLALVEAWDPIAYIDLHATNGAQFEHDISIQVEPVHAGDAVLREVGRTFRDAVMADLAEQGSLPLPYYPSFVEHDNPASGFEDGVSPPRFSTGYFLLRNRLGMLVETHSWKEYPVRVRITRNTVISVVEQIARHGRDWMRIAREADARAAALGGTRAPLAWKATDASHTVDFRGYAYTRTPSEVSGALMTRYDDTTPQLWRVPMRDTLLPSVEVALPRAGYLVPAAHAAWVGGKLRQHGIVFHTLATALPAGAAEVFRATTASPAAASVEGHQRLDLQGTWTVETHAIGAGALFVPIAQPKARLVAALLEPQAPDSLAAWGRFNTHFERKEYMEDYVAEQVAREMLARDPALRAEFEAKLRDDAAFAASPEARLDFFYRRHSAWDDRYNLYPVLRTDTVPATGDATP